MDNILDKLNQIDDTNTSLNDWSLDEKIKLLEIYFMISNKESHILNLIYQYHSCDSWEDIFRDYDKKYLQDKANGVKIAINKIIEKLKK